MRDEWFFIWTNLIPPSLKYALCQAWLKLARNSREKDFKISTMNFAISSLSPLGRGRGPSFEQTWIPFTQGCFVPSLAEIIVPWLRKRFVCFINQFSVFRNYFPVGKEHGHLFEQTCSWIYFTHEYFVQSLIEIRQVVIEKIFEFRRGILLFHKCSYLPLENGVALHLNKLASPSLKDDALCKVWLKLAQ